MDDVKTRILDVATRLFATRGYGATSVREVVEAAGVTKPTLYYWFSNKEALFLEAVTSRIGRMHGLLANTLHLGAADAPPLAADGDEPLQAGEVVHRLRRFCRRYVRDALSDPSGVLLLMTCQLPADGQPEVDLLSVQDATLQAIAATLDLGRRAGEVRADLDPQLGAISLVGAFNLLIVAGLHGAPVGPDAPDQLLDLFLHGAASR